MKKRWRALLLVALGIYLASAGALVFQHEGLQYDEALMVLGAVQMLHSPGQLLLPYDPHTWLFVQGRYIQLMTARYVGAAKEYLCLRSLPSAPARC